MGPWLSLITTASDWVVWKKGDWASASPDARETAKRQRESSSCFISGLFPEGTNAVPKGDDRAKLQKIVREQSTHRIEWDGGKTEWLPTPKNFSMETGKQFFDRPLSTLQPPLTPGVNNSCNSCGFPFRLSPLNGKSGLSDNLNRILTNREPPNEKAWDNMDM